MNINDPGHLTFESENLAMPEIHTHEAKVDEEINEEINMEKENEKNRPSGILFDNVAIPEIHIKK